MIGLPLNDTQSEKKKKRGCEELLSPMNPSGAHNFFVLINLRTFIVVNQNEDFVLTACEIMPPRPESLYDG